MKKCNSFLRGPIETTKIILVTKWILNDYLYVIRFNGYY